MTASTHSRPRSATHSPGAVGDGGTAVALVALAAPATASASSAGRTSINVPRDFPTFQRWLAPERGAGVLIFKESDRRVHRRQAHRPSAPARSPGAARFRAQGGLRSQTSRRGDRDDADGQCDRRFHAGSGTSPPATTARLPGRPPAGGHHGRRRRPRGPTGRWRLLGPGGRGQKRRPPPNPLRRRHHPRWGSREHAPPGGRPVRHRDHHLQPRPLRPHHRTRRPDPAAREGQPPGAHPPPLLASAPVGHPGARPARDPHHEPPSARRRWLRGHRRAAAQFPVRPIRPGSRRSRPGSAAAGSPTPSS